MAGPSNEDAWCLLTDEPLDVDAVSSWIVRPTCGAGVVFTGTARDHAPGRTDVTRLEYEAYEDQVMVRLSALAAEASERWPMLGRVALHHRVGNVAVGQPAVVVGVSTPHRAEAFEAARWAIDTLKATVPIWKKEFHAGGESWGTEAQHLEGTASSIPTATSTSTATGG